MALVAINNLHFQYAGSNNPTLIDITTSIRKQEFILLLGPTGCGKTSLCRCINGIIPHFYQGKYSGNVIVNEKETLTSEVYDLATSAGLVFQNPDNQLVSLNVERELAFAPENLGLPREEIHSRVEEIIELLELEKIRKKPPFELSGGEQQRVAIGSILTLKPKLIMLDEPTANLDPTHAREIISLLDHLHHTQKSSILLVEHRLDLVSKFATRILVMDKGRLVLDAEPKQAFQTDLLQNIGVNLPRITELFLLLQKKGYKVSQIPHDIDNALELYFGGNP